MSVELCDIIIPVWNQPEVTRECIGSIFKYTDYPYRLIVIDNGSDEETAGYLNSLKKEGEAAFTLIRNEKNLGFVKAVNQGIKESDAAYVCVMNNDTIATAGWLAELVKVIEADERIGLVNPSSNTLGQFPARGESIDTYASSLKRSSGQTQELYSCRGFCMLIKRKVIEKVGILDEIYDVGYYDEADYCERARLFGFKAVRAKAAYVYHRERASFDALGYGSDLFRKNEKIFLERWGRPLKVGYFLDRIDSPVRIDDIAVSLARSGHQVLIFLRKGLGWPITIDHFDIRRHDIDGIFFSAVSIYKILKRRRKKKLDIILTDNKFFGRFLKMTGFLHRSSVYINPDKASLSEALRRK